MPVDFNELARRLSSNSDDLRRPLFQYAMERIMERLRSGAEVRLFVDGTAGMGHQSSSIHVMRRLVERLGYGGLVRIVYKPGEEETGLTLTKLELLVPGFDPAHPEAEIDIGGARATATAWADRGTLPPVEFGLTGGADGEENFAVECRVNYFLRLQPYFWDGQNEIVTSAEQVALDAPQRLGASFVRRAYWREPPDVIDSDWAWYKDNGPVHQRTRVKLAHILVKSRANLYLQPVYGIREQTEIGLPPAEVLLQLAASIHMSRARGSGYPGPAVIVSLDQVSDTSLDELEMMIGGGLSAREELLSGQADDLRQGLARGLVADEAPARASLIQVEMLLRNAQERARFLGIIDASSRFHVWRNLTPDELTTKIEALEGHADHVVVLQLGRLPQIFFDHLFAIANLPSIFEGQGTAALALNLGKPYLHLPRPEAQLNNYPSLNLQYPHASVVAAGLQDVSKTLLSGFSENNEGSFIEVAETVGSFIREVGLGRADAVTKYFASVRDFYRSELNDKFLLGVVWLEYLIHNAEGGSLPPVRLAALTAPRVEAPLDALYARLEQNLSGGVLNLVPGALSDGPIATFYKKLGTDGKVVLNGAGLSADRNAGGDVARITVTGDTSVSGVPLRLEAMTFTMELGAVQSRARFAGAVPWELQGMPWIGLERAGFEAVVAEGDVPPVVRLLARVRGTSLEVGVSLPWEDQILVSGSFDEPQSPAELFSMAGGVDVVAALPAPLSTLAGLGATRAQVVYDRKGGVVESVSVTLATRAPWELFPLLAVEGVVVEAAVMQPTGSRQVTAVVTGTIRIGAGPSAGIVQVSASAPRVTVQGRLARGEIAVADLLRIFLPGVPLELSSLPRITAFEFAWTAATRDWSVSCALNVDLPIEIGGTRLLLIERVAFAVSASRLGRLGMLRGSVLIGPDDPTVQVGVDLTATYASATGWTYLGRQTRGRIDLPLLVKRYLGVDTGLHLPIADLAVQATPRTSAFEISGRSAEPWTVEWLPNFSLAASAKLGYRGKASGNGSVLPAPRAAGGTTPGFYGDVSAQLEFYSVRLDLAYVFDPQGQRFQITWEGITVAVEEKEVILPDKTRQKQWMATLSMKGQTLGSMVEKMVGWATGEPFGLSAPWNALNSVKLDGLELAFNFTTRQVKFTVPVLLDLGFASLRNVAIIYDPNGAKKVKVTLEGRFLWVAENPDAPLDWDATDPGSTPAPPGGGNKYLDLRLLAMGQHVSVTGLTDAQTVQAAVAVLRGLKVPTRGRIPVGKKEGETGQPFFAPESNWLIAADFGVLRLDEKKPATLALSREALDALTPQQVAALAESGTAVEVVEGGWAQADADPSRPAASLGGAAGTVEVGTFARRAEGGDGDGATANGDGGGGDGLVPGGRLPVRVPLSLAAAGEKKPPKYMLQMSVIFNDPRIYALRIALDKDAPAAKIFKGLDFQIMYRRVTDTVGVYQAEIALPAAMREISIGAYSITLPVFGIAVYTNGDFMIDVGFPWNQDFSRSFTIQGIVYPGIPLIGSAGFYFGKLSGDTATMVPKTKLGYFNPVIVFGLGVQVGVGKTFEKGILRAGFSVTVVGIVEGVIAKFNPFIPASTGGSPANQLQGDYYFWLQGTVGIIGRLFGAVDFAIIKAEVNVTVKLLAQITYESYADLTFSVIASVEISVSIEIDLGLFSFSIDFSFSARIKETFTLKNSGQAPWLETGASTRLAGAHARSLRALLGADLAAAPLAWGNLTPATGAETPLTAWLAPALTAAGDGSLQPRDQKPAYVAMLFVQSSPPVVPAAPADAAPTSFDALAAQAFRWAVAAATRPMTAAEVDDLQVEDAVLEAILAALADPARPLPISPEEAGAFMDGQFHLKLTVPTETGQANATVFPVPPPLTLSVPSRGLDYAFRDFNELGDDYVRSLRTYFDALAVQVQTNQGADRLRMMAVATPDHSMAGFVFADYFRLLVRQMVQGGRDALRAYQLPVPEGRTGAWIVEWVNANGSMRAVVDGAPVSVPFSLDVLFEGNADHPLRAGVALRIQDAPYPTQGAETLDGVAGRFGGAFGAAALAERNAERGGVLAAGAVVRVPGREPRTVTPGDTFATVAAALGVDVASLVRDGGLAAQAGLLAPFAGLVLPAFTHTTAAGDTLESVARRYGLAVAGLAVAENGAVAEPWVRGDRALVLPHLAAFRVRELLAEAGRSGGIRQLGSMASRYLLAGLRLPTKGIRQKEPCACGNGTTLPEECGLYALTGQQFTLPDVVDTGFSFSLEKGDDLKWVWLNGDAAARELKVTLRAEDVARVDAVRAAAQKGVRPATRRLGGQRAFERTDGAYALSPVTPWRSAGTVPMTYGTPPAVPSLAVWSFPATLTDLPHPAADAVRPRFVPRLAVYDEATGTTRKADPGAYAWGMQLPVGIKRIPAVPGSPSTAWTYELSGAGEAATALLERLVRTLKKGDDSWAKGIYLLYPPSPAGNAREGLLSDAADRVSFFVSQVNLSTETNPEASAARANALLAETVPAGCWNTPGDFVRLLWENSVTRSGGYFLYYYNADAKGGLPDRVFNDRGEATLTVLLTFSSAGSLADNQVAPFMNCLVTAGAGDPTRSVLFAEASPVEKQVSPDATESLEAFAARYYTDALSIVEDNPEAALRAGARVRITDGVYEVRPGAPGGTLGEIAPYFGLNADEIRKANPQIPDWSGALAVFTAVRLPGKEAVVGSDRGGATLEALATFYGAPLSALAASNQDRADLFAGPLTVNTGPVVRTSTVAAGTVAVAAERTVPQVPAKPAPDNRWGELYLEKTYGLLGWRVAGNAWFGRSEQMGLPVGPADAGDPAAQRGAAPAKRAADDPWRYQQLVPAYRFAGGTPRPGEPERSPYAGLGGLLQVEFGWQDLYGNRMLSPLQRPDLDPASPLNLPPLPVGYADALVGPGGWPSVSFAWDVVKRDATAVLRVELGFDPSQYTGNGTPEGDEKARQNALRDLRIYERLQLQLFRGAGEVTFALESSLLRAGAAAVDGTAVRAWVGAVAGFVADRARGGRTAQHPAALPVEQGLAPDTVNPAPVFELTASLVMARPREAVLADFRDTPEVWRSAARVPPRAAGGAGEAVSLRAFALAFEDALATDAARIKVASGVNRERTVRPGTSAPLWAVRVGTGPGAVAFRVLDAGRPWLYAPRPVSNTLRSRSRVPIWNYETGKGIVIEQPGGGQRPPDRQLDFGGVDVDVWLRQLLEAVDSVLSPEFTSPLGILSRRSGRDFLAGPGGLLDQKRDLANVVQTLVIPVLRDQADPGSKALDAAREGFRQQLLVRLASAYTITGVVQFRAAVPGPVPQPNFDPPRLFGIPTARAEPGAATDATLTAARVELRATTEQDPVHLTFMVSARGGAAGTGAGSALPLSLEYRATHLEQEIGKVQGIGEVPGGESGYRASSWLAFVLPPAPGEAGPLSADLGSFDVPLVLRAFPTPPSLTAQDGTASGAVKDGGVGEASAWDYAFTFREDFHHAQDHTHLRVVYNLSERRRLAALTAVPRDLFDTLAEWVTVGPVVRADLARWLAPIDPTTTDETVFRNAAAAVDAFTLLARDVAKSWASQFSRGTLQGGGAGGPSGLETVEERYVEEERSRTVTEGEVEVEALMTVLRGPFDRDGKPLPAPLVAPEVRIPGWTAKRVTEVTDGYAYVYVRKDDRGVERHLPVLEGRAIPDRTVVLPGLNVLGRQDAWSASWIVRNAELIQGRPTADPFVYTTSEIRFASVLHPTLDHGEPIDVARIGGEGRAVRRSLSGHLGALLQGLFAPDPKSEQTLQLEVRYEFALSAGMPAVSLPVLLLPPATFGPKQLAIPDGGCPAGVTPDGTLPCNLAAAVEQWFGANTPSGVEGVLRLDLTVMSRLTEQPMPLLRLRTLVLKLGDVNPPLPTRPV